MDCNQAELAMMAQMEKTIQPAQARDLVLHMLSCETCKEYYIGFDMALDVLNDPELSIAPPDFTQTVMPQVRKLPVYVKPEPTSISVTLRILWGFSAIALGIALLFALNPEWLPAFSVMDSARAALSDFRQYAAGLVENLSLGYNGLGSSMLTVSLVFAVVVGVLLVVLQRTEKSHNS